ARLISFGAQETENVALSSEKRSLRGSSCQRSDHRAYTQDAHHALKVIGKHMKAHLGAYARKRLGYVVGPTHPVLDGCERVFHRLSSHSHHLGLPIEPLLHRFEDSLVFPAPDAPVLGSGTARPDRTARAR